MSRFGGRCLRKLDEDIGLSDDRPERVIIRLSGLLIFTISCWRIYRYFYCIATNHGSAGQCERRFNWMKRINFRFEW